MAKKVVLIVLIVIAVAAAVFLGVGAAQDSRGETVDENYKPDPKGILASMDNLFKGTRKPLDMKRLPARLMTGCALSGRVLTFTALCDVGVDTSKTKSAQFKLTNIQGSILGAFAFTRAGLDSMWRDSHKRSELDPEKPPRFVVTKDGAFLRLFCQNDGGMACRVTVE